MNFPNRSITHVIDRIFNVQEEHSYDSEAQLAVANEIAAEASEAFHDIYGEYSDPWL